MNHSLIFLFLISLIRATASFASPSESNYFDLLFVGEEAENFKNSKVYESSSTYGTDDSNIMYDSWMSHVRKNTASEREFALVISCQQRVENYQSANPKFLNPLCTFVYFYEFTRMNAEEKLVKYIESHTTIDMTPEISKQMIKNFSWKKTNNNKGSYYFGCYDNRGSGCPNILYIPAWVSNAGISYETEVNVSYYKP